MTLDDEKRAAAERAVAEIEDGMVVGLGSGSTAGFALEALARRVGAGLTVRGIPTSERTAALALRLNLTLTSLAEHRAVDLTIDGADLIERGSFALVKGGGGSLLREKLVALASRRLLVIADHTKLVDRLPPNTVIPVEIVRFGHETVLDRLAALGAAPRLRLAGGAPFISDGGNLIADCVFAAIDDPAALAGHLKALTGVVESGLFIGLARTLYIGHGRTVEVIER